MRWLRWLFTSHRLLHLAWIPLRSPSGQVVRLLWLRWGGDISEDDQTEAVYALRKAGYTADDREIPS
jgi:hypothetical protein